MTFVDDKRFDDEKKEIEQDITNTLARVVNDYSSHWRGIIGEFVQNSYDAWAYNRFDTGVLDEDAQLTVRIEVNMNKRTLKLTDTAGGMDESTFTVNFAGLDTPGEEKQDGEFGGSYGRGVHVIAQAGEEMYAETHTRGYRGGMVVRGAHQMELSPRHSFDRYGTTAELTGVEPDLLVSLSDWDAVHRYLRSRFQAMLAHDNIRVEYTIDGVEHVAQPLDFRPFDVLWEGGISFEVGGEEYTIDQIRIYDATSADTAVPINGVSLLKRNEHMNLPFMEVQDYRPRQLRHLDKMFGIADASDLCPEYENNAHTSFTSSVISDSGLKQVLETVEREHFIGTPTDLDEKEAIVDTTLEIVNEQWEHDPFDGGDPDLEPETETAEGEDDDLDETVDADVEQPPDETADDEAADDLDEDDADDEEDEDLSFDDLDIDWEDEEDADEDPGTDETTGDEDEEDTPDEPEPSLTCSTRHRSYGADDEALIWAVIDNPSGSEYEQFTIRGDVEHTDSGTVTEVDSMDLSVLPGTGTGGDDTWGLDLDATGKYTFEASLYERGKDDEATPIDTASTWFWVGRDTTEDEQPASTVAFLEEVVLVRKGDEDSFRAELREGDRGMMLIANTRHPEYRHSVKLDGSSGKQNQVLTLVRWAHEAIMNRLLIDRLDSELADYRADNGEPLSEELGQYVRSQLIEQTSTLMADAHREV